VELYLYPPVCLHGVDIDNITSYTRIVGVVYIHCDVNLKCHTVPLGLMYCEFIALYKAKR
jgi:hypothetical protein